MWVWLYLNRYSRNWENMLFWSSISWTYEAEQKMPFWQQASKFADKDTNCLRSKADGLKKARPDTGGKYHKT